MSKRKSPPTVDFTDEDAYKFKLSMRDPDVRAKLYEETRLKSEQLRNSLPIKIERESASLINEHGFTNEEVDFLKEALSEYKTGGNYRRHTHKRSRKTRKTRKNRKSRKSRKY